MIKDRLVEFIKFLGLKNAEFERECGFPNGYVNNIRRSITPEKLEKISIRYPELNRGWLMTGEGEMFLKDENTPQNPVEMVTLPKSCLDTIVSQQVTISKQTDTINRQLDIIERLTDSIGELKKTSAQVAPMECDAGCAAAG